MAIIMKEFDYLVSWVKDLCDKAEKAEFESALLAGNSIGVWYYIWSKVKDEVKDSNSPPNPRYEGFLELCKKNPSLDLPSSVINCTTDACLEPNLQAVVKAKYPDAECNFRGGEVQNPFVVQQSNETVESENNQPMPGNDQSMPITNPLKDKFNELSSKYNKRKTKRENMKEHERMIRFVCEDCNYNMIMGEDDSGTRFYCPTCNSILDERFIDDD